MPTLVGEKELELAEMLVNAQRGTFDAAKLQDKFKQRVLDAIEQRPRAAAVGRVADQERRPTEAIDLLDALEKSLQVVPKPVQRETLERRSKTRDGRRTKY